MPSPLQQLLSSADIALLQRLTLDSRFTVEGNLQGAHPSPHRGFSVEFADYRPYVPGDDPRRLDWKVYARNERLYVRQYEEECNLRLHLLVDGSRSMAFSGDPAGASKYNFAARLAAMLAFVTIRQNDSVGLTVFNSEVVSQLPARSATSQLRLISEQLLSHDPGKSTSLAHVLHKMADTLHRRAVIVVISDLLDDLQSLRKALAHFRRKHHDVIIYQVMDPFELDFPFNSPAAFQDMETGQTLETEPRRVRREYQRALGDFLRDCRKLSASLNVDYSLLQTRQSPAEAVRRHLARRKKQ